MLTIRQIRAARALLDLDQEGLARLTGVSRPTIQRVEHPDFGPTKASAMVLEKIRTAIEAAGVLLLHPDEEAGEGVRLRSQGEARDVRGRARGRARPGASGNPGVDSGNGAQEG